jgi:hypothetical protein
VILSILLVGLVRTIVPDVRPDARHGTRPNIHVFALTPLVCGIFNGGILMGYDQAQGWGMAMPMFHIMTSRMHQWIPWVWCQQIRPLAVVYLFVPLWIPSTVLLAVPALLRPHKFAPGALLRRFVDFLRLSPRA